MPSTVPATVSRVPSGPNAMPKSPSFSRPSRRSRRFCGFTSRWTRPAACAAASARAACAPERRRLERRQRAAAGDQVGERLAVDVLHRDVRDAVGLADVEDLDDVRVRQPRGDPPLAEEARAQVVVAGEILGETLERDVAAELDVAGEVDHGHRAVTERPLDLVPAGDGRRGQRSPGPWPWW